jgi:hypothetical protein
MLLTTLHQTCPGESVMLAACADLMTEEGPLGEVRFVVPRGSPIDPLALAEITGTDPLEHGAVLRLVYKHVYKERCCLAGLPLQRHLSALAAAWRPSGPEGVGLVMWTRRCPARRPAAEVRRRPLLANGEVEDGFRPRIRIHPMGGERAQISFLGRGEPDPVDRIPEGKTKPERTYRFPGYLLDLTTATYAATGTTPRGLRDAGALFGLDLHDPSICTSAIVSSTLIEGIRREIEDTALLYRAVLRAHRARLHDA